jgi:hypothetical protein
MDDYFAVFLPAGRMIGDIHRQTGGDRNNTIAARIPTFQIFKGTVS